MALCTKPIKDTLTPESPYGGIWTYKGYDASSSVGDYNDTPATPLFVGINIDDTIPYGDNFNLITEGVSAGFYKLNYIHVGGTDVIILKVESESTTTCTQSHGISLSVSDNTEYDLIELIDVNGCTVTNGGTWTNIDSAIGFTDGIYNPSLDSAGTYTFLYSLKESGFDNEGCATCPPLECLFTVVVTDEIAVFITQSDTTCSYSLAIEDPDTNSANFVKIVVDTDAENPYASYNAIVTSCQGELQNTTRQIYATGTALFIRNDIGDPMQTGGFYRTLRLRSSLGSDIIVPLAPSGANQATFTGVGGSTNATDLTFNASNPGIFKTAIEIAIKNYLGGLGYTNGTHYRLLGLFNDTQAANPSRGFQIRFGCKHNPSSTWIGLRKSDARLQYYPYSGSMLTEYTVASEISTGISNAEVYSSSPCPNGANQLNILVSVLELTDIATLDFDNIEADTTYKAATVTGNDAYNCDGITLTANVLNCDSGLTYLWSTGETSSSIDILNGTFTVDCTCSSPSDTGSASITV